MILRLSLVVVTAALCCGQQAEPVTDLGTPDGLKGKVYFIPALTRLPDFDRLEPVATIYTNPINVVSNSKDGFPGISKRSAWFAIDYTGRIYIREPGAYFFQLISDDGSKFYIDGQVVIDNDHGLGDWTGQKTVKLTGGTHRVRLSYWQGPYNHHCITLRLLVEPPRGKNPAPFNTLNFSPPLRREDWKYGSPSDFDIPADADVGRVRLKDVIATRDGVSLQDVVSAVRLALAQHTPDKSLAKSIGQLVLKEKLDSTAIEELQSEGAGPETVAALEWQRVSSSGLPAATGAPVYDFPPRPSIADQTSFFRLMSSNAMHYTHSLPDFICTETIFRYTASVQRTETWKKKDVLDVKLTYFGNHEKYDLTMVNGHKTGRDFESAGGAIEKGDFGTQLLEIFAPDSETKFKWDHWTRLRKGLTQVYSYATPVEHSHYKLTVGVMGYEHQTAQVGRHGFVYADEATHMVVRITGQADSIPEGFPVKAATNILDYDMADVGGRKFLLPLRAEHLMRDSGTQFKNVEEFHDYRKFVGESSISFGDPDSPTPP